MDEKTMIAIIRQIGSDISGKIDALEAKMDALAEKIEGQAPGGEMSAQFEAFNSSLETLGHAVGEVHSHVSSGEPLPEKVLMDPVMDRFVRAYPERAAHPFNKVRRDGMMQRLQDVSEDELTTLLASTERDLQSGELTAREEFNLKDAAKGIAQEIERRERQRLARDRGVGR